jgi:hypothetical protein
MTISFQVSKQDNKLIGLIADRAIENRKPYRGYKRDLVMDLTACHANGTPLKLYELLRADDFDFQHDIFGIREHLNRTTGKLKDYFLPRYAR